MNVTLEKTKRYMASVYFKTDYPLKKSTDEGFSNTYSNIQGWGFENTDTTRYEENGWTRLYTKWGITASYASRVAYTTYNFTVNTTSTENIIVSVDVILTSLIDYQYLYAVVAHNPGISNNAGLTGLSILNHGLDSSSWAKLSYPNNIKLKSEIPYTYYMLLSVPSTGGVDKTITIRPAPTEYLDSLNDNKFWKVTFDVTDLHVNDIIKTYWTCPMIEETTGSYPSIFTIGTRGATTATGGGAVDLASKSSGEIINDVVLNGGSELGLIFDGIDDAVKFAYNKTDLNSNPSFSIGAFIKRTGRITNGGCWGIGGDGNLMGISCYTLADNKITIDLAGTATFSTNIDYPLNQYVHVIWIKRIGQFNTTNISIYINGVEYTGDELTVVRGSTHTPALNTSTKGIILGTSSTETASFYVPCVISLFRIYSRVLSFSEITQNYNSYCNKFNLPII
jgi:hypothetical protein